MTKKSNQLLWKTHKSLTFSVDTMISKKTSMIETTFEQLFETCGKELRITAVSMNDASLVWFDRHTHPDMPVALAVRASTSLPFVFAPLEYEGDRFVDGG